MDTRKINYFVGVARERNAAQGLKTLYVVGAPPAYEIAATAAETRAQHVALGANHPRNPRPERFDPNALDWPRVIDELLARNLRVTLEYLPAQHDWVLANLRQFFDRPGFVAQMVVPVPENLPDSTRWALKIDNSAGANGERGAWVWPLPMLRSEHRYTGDVGSAADEIVGRRG